MIVVMSREEEQCPVESPPEASKLELSVEGPNGGLQEEGGPSIAGPRFGLWWRGSSFFGASSSSVGPVANATDVLQPTGLLYSPYPPRLFGRSHIRRQVPPRPQ